METSTGEKFVFMSGKGSTDAETSEKEKRIICDLYRFRKSIRQSSETEVWRYLKEIGETENYVKLAMYEGTRTSF